MPGAEATAADSSATASEVRIEDVTNDSESQDNLEESHQGSAIEPSQVCL